MRLKPDQSIFPCPFCYGELMGHAYIKVPGRKDALTISCDNCGASGPVISYANTLEDLGKAESEAVSAWNNLVNFRPTQKVEL
jgi:transcription elongation factor Elf1